MSKAGKKEWELRLIGGYSFDEVTSSLQKMIRRGKEYEAVHWGYVLHQSGYGAYLWRRLAIICSEDIGNGSPQSAILVNALWNSWEKLHKHNKQPTTNKFLLPTQAILHLCRAAKSREDDSLVNLIDLKWKNGERLPVLEVSKDCHTRIGKKKYGRFGDLKDGKEKMRIEKWFGHWAKINNKAYQDKWETEFKKLWTRKATSQQTLNLNVKASKSK